MIHGCSTGGVGAALWANYIRDRLPKPVKMYAILDGALLYDGINVKTNNFLYR